ncbi:MAG: S-layer homology domain-containing protein, partial [Clostridia bacterium]|nr:S-layer homology domain-containing protein [Clostridia bacterium]
MKKALSIILTLCMLFGLTAVFASAEEAEMPFTDVKSGKWFYDEVKYVWEAGVMTGKSDTKFEPNANMTRAELVTILFRLAKVEGEGFGEELGFNDTKKTAWYADYVGWAVKEGLVNGYEGNIFKPNAPILRQELAKLVVVFLDYLEVTVEGEALIDSFADAAKHPKWAAEFIESLRLTGLVGGDTSGNFNPKATATRAEVATILTRLIPALEKTPDVDLPKEPVLNFDEGEIATNSPDDPSPDNIGILYEDSESGLKISEVLDVDDTLTTPGAETEVNATATGIHGWHETRVVRTPNGTYVTYISGDRPDDGEYPLGNTYTWDRFSVLKITSDGIKVIYEDYFHHANGSCTPNILKGDNGMIYVTIIADDKDAYLGSYNGSGFTREAAWLTVYEIDTNTDTCTAQDHASIDYPMIGVHGYGYSQPVLDRSLGKIYAIHNGGLVPGYVTWFTYDIATHSWEPEAHIIELPWRIGYLNAYADGMGGMFFVAERTPAADELGELLGVNFAVSSYVGDSIYLIRIPDVTKNEYEITTIYEATYSTEDARVTAEKTRTYGEGATLLASDGKLHVIYSNIQGNKTTTYYAIYDVLDGYKELKNEK